MDINQQFEQLGSNIKGVMATQETTSKEVQALSARLNDLTQKLSQAEAVETAETTYATLGEAAAAAPGYKDFLAGKTSSLKFEVDLAAIKTTDAKPYTPRMPGIYELPQLDLPLQGSLPRMKVATAAIEVACEKTFTNSAAEIAEGAKFPESGIALEVKTFNVKKIAHHVTITRETLQDHPQFVALINNRLVRGLLQRIEKQLLNGDGSGQNIGGLLKSGNYVEHGFNNSNSKGLNTVEIIKKAAVVMRKTGRKPSVVYMNPMDVFGLSTIKDKQDRPLYPTIDAGDGANPLRLKIIESAEVPEGKFLVADPMGALILDRVAVELEEAPQNGENAVQGMTTLLGTVRIGLAVIDPNSFIGGNLAITG